MVNGSFHDELLSVHKTTIVSLTHQITLIAGAVLGVESVLRVAAHATLRRVSQARLPG
jgi:hypothetical protein